MEEEEEDGEQKKSEADERRDLLMRAIAKAKEAHAADEAHDFETAFTLYKASIDLFMPYLKKERIATRRKMLREKILQLLQRAESIKSGEGVVQSRESTPKKPPEEPRPPLLHPLMAEGPPKILFSDVAGFDCPKMILRDLLADLCEGSLPYNGVLLYGPPGCGKSFLARAVWSVVPQVHYYSACASDLVSKWCGEGERILRNCFEVARANQPSIIVLDELDAFVGKSEYENSRTRRMRTELLVQMHISKQQDASVLVVGLTNLPWALPPCVRRRFSRWFYLGLPGVVSRAKITRLCLGSTPTSLSASEIFDVARRCQGFSGADMNIFVRNALMEPVRTCQTATHFKRISLESARSDFAWFLEEFGNHPEIATAPGFWTPCRPSSEGAVEMSLTDVKPPELMPPRVSLRDFEKILLNARASVSKEDLVLFQEFMNQFGEGGVAAEEDGNLGEDEAERLKYLLQIENCCSVISILRPDHALRITTLACFLLL